MLCITDFVSQSLETHLHFARTMKEHSFFLEIGFTPRDSRYINQADNFRKEFDALLKDVVLASDGVVSPDVLQSGEVVTKYTISAEEATSFYTGVDIPIELSKLELELMGKDMYKVSPKMEQCVYSINEKAIELISGLIKFKSSILSNVLSCKMFTVNYPLLIDHIMREAKLYLQTIQRLQHRKIIDVKKEAMEQELFWNRIMAEHSKFIRGLLDPTEEELIHTANQFGNEFDQLTEESKEVLDKTMPLDKVTEDSFRATVQIRDFKEQGTKGILECNVRSIIIPLLGDHVIREASHYLRLLKMYREL